MRNFDNIYIIYKCGSGSHNKNRRAAGWRPVSYVVPKPDVSRGDVSQGRFPHERNVKIGSWFQTIYFDQETYIYTYENIHKNEVSQTNDTLRRRYFVGGSSRSLQSTSPAYSSTTQMTKHETLNMTRRTQALILVRQRPLLLQNISTRSKQPHNSLSSVVFRCSFESVPSNTFMPASIESKPFSQFDTVMVLFLGSGSCSSASSSTLCFQM